MRVFLNGNIYELQAGTGVTRYSITEFPTNIRTIGQRRRTDRNLLDTWEINDWSGGFGDEYARSNYAPNTFWDVENCDTRHGKFIVLSPAFNTCTVVPSRNVNKPFAHLADLYFAEPTGTTYGGIIYKFTAPNTIGSFKLLHTSALIGSITAILAQGNDIVFTALDDLAATRIYKTQGIGIVNAVAIGSIYNNSSLGWEPQMAFMGGTLHLITLKDDKAHFYLSNLGTAHYVASLSVAIGTHLSPMVTDGLTMFAPMPDGIYDFDVTPSKVIDYQGTQDKNANAAIYKQLLYYKNKKSVNRYDGTDITAVGYDLIDDFHSSKMGEVTAFAATSKYLYAAVKGASYSHILAYNGAWQFYAQIPTMGLWVRKMWFSDGNDGIDRLWCQFGNHPYPGYFLNPLVNPLQAPTYSYVATGHILTSAYAGGMNELQGGFYGVTVIGDVSPNNPIIMGYRLNKTTGGYTTWGTVGTSPAILPMWNSGHPYGKEGYNLQTIIMLRGNISTGTSPVFREAMVQYLKIPTIREAFDFVVDIDKTAKSRARPLENVIGSLNYEASSKVLMPFHYGQIATKRVLITNSPFAERLEDTRIYEGERIGLVKIICAEVG